MASNPVCPRCTEPLPSGEPDCPYCAGRKRLPLHRRESVVIAGVIILAAGLWVATHYATRAYAARQQQLAQQWYGRGESDLGGGRLPAAVEELRTALAYSPDNFVFRLRLAEALAAQGRTHQAQAYLRALWEEEPGNGTVNLELARLAAKTNDVAGALRFYHGAIYGVWPDNAVSERRRQARFELVEFLLNHNQMQQAQSELIALAADLPRDPALMTRVAGLMMKAGEYRRAMMGYQQVLALQPHNPQALAGAGEVAFSLQMYSWARDYLRRAFAEHMQDPRALADLQVVELVLQMDPYQPGLSQPDRERRITQAFVRAGDRLQQCAAARGISLTDTGANNALADDFASWTTRKRSITARNLRRNPAQGDSAMDLAFQIERDTAQICGPGTAADQALLLIAQRRERTAP